MTEMLKPQSGESVYDPTCGSAGMLISCIAYLKERGLEWKNLKVYGQEINQLKTYESGTLSNDAALLIKKLSE